MGDFRIVVEGAGGHGCDRHAGDMDQVYGCGSMNCPDCLTREFVKFLQDKFPLSKATFTHWPKDFVARDGSMPYKDGSEIVDDLLTKIRHGSFPKQS
jgi:hypothetical protein